MATAGETSSSGRGVPEEMEVVSESTRSCRGCLYYSSILREQGRNPICLGLSRSGEPQVYSMENESLEKELAKNLQKFSDFKYACVGYSAHKELVSTRTSQAIVDGPGQELPYCVGLELIADTSPTRRGIPAHPPPHTTSVPPDQSQTGEDGPIAMPKPPSSIGGHGAGGLSGDEFATRFFRTSRLVASAVVNNVSKVGNSIRRTVDEIFTSDQDRPKP